MSEVTLLMQAADEGDPNARSKLVEFVYPELRRVAANRLRGVSKAETIQPTALVNEVYVRLFRGDRPVSLVCRKYFFAAAAEAMRRILIERARKRRSGKAGGGWRRRELSDEFLAVDLEAEHLLEVDDCLQRLAKEHARPAEVFCLRHFGGRTDEQIADLLEVAPRTVRRDAVFAKAWLRRELAIEAVGPQRTE